MSEWQPIETAPRDGTIILLIDMYYDKPTVKVGAFYESWDGFPWTFIDAFCEDPFNGWRDDLTGPTHWMPLPEPPQGDEND